MNIDDKIEKIKAYYQSLSSEEFKKRLEDAGFKVYEVKDGESSIIFEDEEEN